MKMKRVIFSLLFCISTIYINGQDFFMYVEGKKRTFEVSSTKMLVKSETLDAASIKNEMQRTGVNSVINVYELNHQLFLVELQKEYKENLFELQSQWNAKESVIYTSPVFVDEEGKVIAGLTNQILIRLKDAADYSLLLKSIVSYPIKLVKQCEFDKKVFLLTLESGVVKNAMQISNELHETGLF